MKEVENWKAKWIWSEGLPRTSIMGSHQMVYFRRTFELPEQTECHLKIHVSADSRYRLFCNGQSVSLGPCKGDRNTWYYETVDLSALIKPGKNVLAAKVLHFDSSEPYLPGGVGPVAVWRSDSGGFILEGALMDSSGQVIEELHSDRRWKCLRDQSLAFDNESFTLFVGGKEIVNGSKFPHGWEMSDYDDSAWGSAVPFSETMDRFTGQLTPWQLEPRPIPPLFEEDKAFQRLMKKQSHQGGLETFFTVPTGQLDFGAVRLAAGEKLMVELDAGELSTAYYHLELSGGKGSTIRILCSECYEGPSLPDGGRQKGIRDDAEGGTLRGEYDVYQVGGIGDTAGAREVYEPFWFRTFRFIRLEVEVGDQPITLHRFYFRDTGYPLNAEGEFECSDPSFLKLWNISINTLQRCMHESYEDCPFYEQLQYTMDTRLQILFTYNISRDERLARKAIYDFHSSLLPSGMLQSRYPSVYPQVIPGFALYWIHMIHDHYLYHGDRELVCRYRPTMDAVLDWFDRHLTRDGLVGQLNKAYWSFVDWVFEWKEDAGVPMAGRKGPITVYSLMYAAALQRAAELNRWTGREDTAREYEERAKVINQAVKNFCWSKEKGFFKDGPNVNDFSQHVQIWAVLSGASEGEDAKALMKMTMTDESLSRVSYAMAFFLFRALEKAGVYHLSFPLWDIWKRLSELNLTTWVEDPVSQRSDCHGWGSAPLYEFPALILGVKPERPGYKGIRITPHPGSLSWAKGKVMTCQGPVQVEWRKESSGKYSIKVLCPDSIPVSMRLPDGTNYHFAHGGECTAEWS